MSSLSVRSFLFLVVHTCLCSAKFLQPITDLPSFLPQFFFRQTFIRQLDDCVSINLFLGELSNEDVMATIYEGFGDLTTIPVENKVKSFAFTCTLVEA